MMNRQVFPVVIFLLVAVTGFGPAVSGQSQVMYTGLAGIAAPSPGFTFDLEATILPVHVTGFEIFLSPLNASGGIRCLELWARKGDLPGAGAWADPSQWDQIALYQELPPFSAMSGWLTVAQNLDVLIRPGTRRGFYLTRTDGRPLMGVSFPAMNSTVYGGTGIRMHGNSGGGYFAPSFPGAPKLRIHYVLENPPMWNLTPQRLAAPGANPQSIIPLSTAEHIAGIFENRGAATIPVGTIIPVSVQVNLLPLIQEFMVLGDPLPPGGTVAHHFAPTIDMSTIGAYSFTLSHGFILDQDPADDSWTTTVMSGGAARVTQYPFLENFDSNNYANIGLPPSGWTQDQGESPSSAPLGDWLFVDSYDLPGFVDRSSPGGSWATTFREPGTPGHSVINLRSPILDFSAVSAPALKFWRRQTGNYYPGSGDIPFTPLAVDVLDKQSGVVFQNLTGPFVNGPPNQWEPEIVDLTAFGGRVTQVIFRASTQQGRRMDIDDIEIFAQIPTPGQPPVPGLAVLRVGNALNANGFPLNTATGGPFFVHVGSSSTLTLEFEGEPNMPLLLLGGNLNPAIASYPNIGTMDLGDFYDPVIGLPVGLILYADGHVTTGLNPLFNTGITGTNSFSVLLPNVPPGVLATFQCLMDTTGTNGAPFALSNTVQVVVN